MKIINIKNFERINENPNIIFENIESKNNLKIKGIVINNEIIPLKKIPSIKDGECETFLLQNQMSDYIIHYDDKENICYFFRLEETIKNEVPIIENFYFTFIIGEDNKLYNFLDYYKSIFDVAAKVALEKNLEKLPYTEEEINWIKQSIENLKSSVKTIAKPKKEKAKKAKYTIPNNVEFEGKTYSSFSALCREFGIKSDTVRKRLNKGMDLTQALKKPLMESGRRANKKWQEETGN